MCIKNCPSTKLLHSCGICGSTVYEYGCGARCQDSTELFLISHRWHICSLVNLLTLLISLSLLCNRLITFLKQTCQTSTTFYWKMNGLFCIDICIRLNRLYKMKKNDFKFQFKVSKDRVRFNCPWPIFLLTTLCCVRWIERVTLKKDALVLCCPHCYFSLQ